MISVPSLYLISLVVSFLVLVFVMVFMSEKASVSLILLLFALVAATFGYYRLSVSQTVEAAILAQCHVGSVRLS